ncbi:hypothetical protein LINPERHAP2_LOCUS7161 [Linum perenne]
MASSNCVPLEQLCMSFKSMNNGMTKRLPRLINSSPLFSINTSEKWRRRLISESNWNRSLTSIVCDEGTPPSR